MNYLTASCPRLISPLAEADEVSIGLFRPPSREKGDEELNLVRLGRIKFSPW